MGGRRGNPKALRAVLQRKTARYNAGMRNLFHRAPKAHLVMVDGRVIEESAPDHHRAQVLSTKSLWQSEFYQHVHEYCFIKVIGDCYPYGLKRFFSGEKYFFQEETFEYYRRSIVYSSKDLAMLAFNTGRITWIERISRQAPVAQVKAPPR